MTSPATPLSTAQAAAGNAPDKRPVLVPLDGSPLAETALPWGVLLAKRWRAPLVLARVVAVRHYGAVSLADSSLGPIALEIEHDEAAAYLEGRAGQLRAAEPTLDVRAEVPIGDPAIALMDLEKSAGARLVVLTTHGRTGLARWARGSVAETIVRYGTAPALLVRPWDEPEPAARLRGPDQPGLRVLVPLDGSPLAHSVLATATELAAGEGGELILTSIVKTDDERAIGPYYVPRVADQRKEMREYLGRLREEARARGVSGHAVVGIEHDVASAIVDRASVEAADVIAISTHGRGTLGRLLYGSVADRVAHAARVPVLLYRPHPSAAPRGPSAAHRVAAPEVTEQADTRELESVTG